MAGHDIKVTVSGPGGNISYQTEIIRRALEAVGCVVIVKDDYADDFGEFKTWEEYDSHRKMLSKSRPVTITLIADHIPWGS